LPNTGNKMTLRILPSKVWFKKTLRFNEWHKDLN
jgi:hypothetical protein